MRKKFFKYQRKKKKRYKDKKNKKMILITKHNKLNNHRTQKYKRLLLQFF